MRIVDRNRVLVACLLVGVVTSAFFWARAGRSPAQLLSDGCELNARGIGTCDTMVGAAHGGNTDPSALEAGLSSRLGVRRTYWSASQVEAAVSVARGDLRVGRLPWLSFKLPSSWEDVAAGGSDSWAVDLAARLSEVGGPVWLAFHHEPEGDGNISAWKRVQERLGPIVRRTADNVAFTVILTGRNQWYGDDAYRIDNIWPKTTVDLAGFDIYCFYGTWKNGKYRTGAPSLKADYFDIIERWAATKGVAWGLAETGLTDAASRDYPEWITSTYLELRATRALAMVYFDSEHNSDDSYHLTGGQKNSDFGKALGMAPTLTR